MTGETTTLSSNLPSEEEIADVLQTLADLPCNPIGEQVLIWPTDEYAGEESEVQIEGWVKPEKYRDLANKGVVLAVGKGKWVTTKRQGKKRTYKQPVTEVKPGDIVLIPYYEGTSLTIHGIDLLLMAEHAILARLTPA